MLDLKTYGEKLKQLGIIPQSAKDIHIEQFMHYAQKLELDPLLGQLIMIERDVDGRKVYQTQASLQGMRVTAQRVLNIVKVNRGVKVINNKLYGFFHVVTSNRGEYYDELPLDEYIQRKKDGKPNYFWSKYPETMIKKCAEESVWRIAVPELPIGEDEIGYDEQEPEEQTVASESPQDTKPEAPQPVKKAKKIKPDDLKDDAESANLLKELSDLINKAKNTQELEELINQYKPQITSMKEAHHSQLRNIYSAKHKELRKADKPFSTPITEGESDESSNSNR